MFSEWARRKTVWLALAIAGLSCCVDAKRTIISTSLSTCMANSGLTASLFDVSFSPDDGQLYMNITGELSITGNVTAEASVAVYGFQLMQLNDLDPCKTAGFESLCPASEAKISITFQHTVSSSDISGIPNIAYTIPDLDAKGRLVVRDTNGNQLACVEAPLGNGHTVHQNAVGWVTAVITGFGLVASAITSGLGHSNTAAHLAANVLTLFGYFQAQAMIGMIAVPLPPLVSAWTQNYDWAVGIINLDFMQDIFTWYIKATGGTADDLLQQVSTVSVQIAKRSVEYAQPYMMSRPALYGFGETVDTRTLEAFLPRSSPLSKRDSSDSDSSPSLIKVTGIERMAFKADIEASNFFMTGLAWLVAFWCFVAILVGLAKGICELAVRAGWMKPSSFFEFRHGWKTVFKGIMYRVVLIGFPQMAILCLWEFTHHDSGGAIALAVFFLLSMIGILGWGCFRVLSIARRSITLEKGPAYSLYADPAALNRWGFLYVQFRSSAYYYIAPFLIYTLVKAFFIALGQNAGTVQGIALMFIELAYLVGVCMFWPWLDKKTNVVNIAVAAVNFLNAIFLMIFSGVTKAPPMVAGVLGVVFFLINVIFAFVLLVLICIAIGYALMSKDPEVKYASIETDLGSNIKKDGSIIRDIDTDENGALPRRISRSASSRQPGALPVPTSSRGPSPIGAGERSRSQSPAPPVRRGSAVSDVSELSARSQQRNWHVGAGYDH